MKKLEQAINEHIIEKSGISNFVHVAIMPAEVAHISYLDIVDTELGQLTMKTFVKKIEVQKYRVAAKIPARMKSNMKETYSVDISEMIDNVLIQEVEIAIFKEIKKKIDLFAEKNYRKTYNKWDKIKRFFNRKYVKKVKIKSIEDLYRRIQVESHKIMQEGRRGAATFVICSAKTGASLENHSACVMMNETEINNHSLPHPVGLYAGITFYVDPRMAYDDDTVYVCRNTLKEEPGIILAFHKESTNCVLAQETNPLSEETRILNVKCAVSEIGEHPEVNYRKFVYKNKKLLI